MDLTIIISLAVLAGCCYQVRRWIVRAEERGFVRGWDACALAERARRQGRATGDDEVAEGAACAYCSGERAAVALMVDGVLKEICQQCWTYLGEGRGTVQTVIIISSDHPYFRQGSRALAVVEHGQLVQLARYQVHGVEQHGDCVHIRTGLEYTFVVSHADYAALLGVGHEAANGVPA